MNINTATLLNLLSPKINPVVKDKLDSLSVNGKIDLETISKDKGVQTLLSGLLKDISVGSNTKENVASLLQNNKQNFSFKNLSEDIKSLVKFIQADPIVSSKLETQLASLKSSLLDIKHIDEKMIKSNVSNSGVLLESKLAQQSIPVSKNIEQLLSLIKGQLGIETTSTIKSDMPNDIKVEIKTAIENILKDIKNIKLDNNPQTQSVLLAKVDSQLKTLQQNLEVAGHKISLPQSFNINNLENIKIQLKDQLSLLNGLVNTNTLQTQMTQIESNTILGKDIKVEIKIAIESLLKDIKNIQSEQNPPKQMQTFSMLETKITTMQQNLNTPLEKSGILATMKDLLVNLKEQIISKNFVDIKNLFTLVEEKISPLIEQNITAKSMKNDIKNILEQLNSLSTNKGSQKQIILQNILNNTQAIHSKSEAIPQVLFENNLSKTANFMNDLKITASVIEEYIQSSKEPVTKELKTIIDKINTQIDFYQLLSYTTNSTHTYLSFLQEEIEDSDIRFHKNNDESFSCQINLTLKQYGDLKILMILDNKNNININIGLEQEEFKSMVQENLQKLRIGINSINLLMQSLNVFSLNSNEQKSIQNGYGNNSHLSFGLDIKA